MLKYRMFSAIPQPDQVAARALGLAALVCRASLEDPSAHEQAVTMHELVLRWVREVDADRGLTPDERRILETAPGGLTREDVARAAWSQEELSVLAWALGRVPLVRANERHRPRWLAARVGFLDPRPLAGARLRPAGELVQYSVVVGEIVEHLRREHARKPDPETALALAVAAGRQLAISWLVGERPLELPIETLADA
jgi:hypothetical protein